MSSARLASSGYTISISDLGVDVGDPVEIQVDVNYANNDNIELLGISLLPRPDSLHGRAVMAKEGP